MSRSWPRLVLAAVAVIGAALARPARAQNSGTIDLGASARYNLYDDDLNLDDAWGLGGRLGWYFSDHWAIEGDAGLTATQFGVADVDHTFEGFGPDQPIASNDTPEGRTQNRRVQLRQLP
ncbi:MAG: outer membrane beta-barrel protein [Gemmatimonadales bacterium]